MRGRRAARALAALTALTLAACGPDVRPLAPTDQAAVARTALTTLFLERERAGELLLWRGTLREAPAFSDLALGDSLAIGDYEPAALAMPVPVRRVDVAALEAHFRANADAWAAWYARHPTSGGIVAVTVPRRVAGDPTRATVLVGRHCGDHCRMAWRVVARLAPDGRWRTDSVVALRVPRN